jgi:hypothetical protein
MKTSNVIFVGVCFGVMALGQTGSISGSVVDDSSNPIQGVIVLYSNLVPLTRNAAGQIVISGQRINSGVVTDAAGQFTISGLPVGTYVLCASGTKATQLRSCEWGQLPTRVVLSAGQAATGLVLQVVDGTLLTLQVNDPNGVIHDLADFANVGGRLPIAIQNFRLGVLVGTRYVPATLVSNANSVRQYQLAVPNGANAQVMIDTDLMVTPTVGTVTAGPGQTPVVFTVQ